MTPQAAKSQERLDSEFTPKFTELQNNHACGKWKVGPLLVVLSLLSLRTSQSKAQRGNGSAASLIIQVDELVFPFPLSMESSMEPVDGPSPCWPWLGLRWDERWIPTASDLQGLARNSRWKPVASAKKRDSNFRSRKSMEK